MRKSYLDNLRSLCVLMLFIFHTCMVYNSFNSFYIKEPAVPVLSAVTQILDPWYMPLLFVIAGISTRYALEKRTLTAYIKERFFRLFVPFAAGLLLLVPLQTYFAERFHNGYNGGYFAQYQLFFTKIGDLTGYTGGFTPAHLWFIITLFVVSLIAVLLIFAFRKLNIKVPAPKPGVLGLLPYSLIIFGMTPVVSMLSISKSFTLFVLGYLILSSEEVQQKLERGRYYLLGGWTVLTVLVLLCENTWHYSTGYIFWFLTIFYGWVGILTALGLGRHFLEFRNRATDYFAKASFPVYILHQSILIPVAFYAVAATDSVALQAALIISCSFVLTMLFYEAFKRIPVTRFLLGIKKPRQKEEIS